jgi:hypothetical protein
MALAEISSKSLQVRCIGGLPVGMLIDVLPDIQVVRLSWFFPNQWLSKRSQLSGSLEVWKTYYQRWLKVSNVLRNACSQSGSIVFVIWENI